MLTLSVGEAAIERGCWIKICGEGSTESICRQLGCQRVVSGLPIGLSSGGRRESVVAIEGGNIFKWRDNYGIDMFHLCLRSSFADIRSFRHSSLYMEADMSR